MTDKPITAFPAGHGAPCADCGRVVIATVIVVDRQRRERGLCWRCWQGIEADVSPPVSQPTKQPAERHWRQGPRPESGQLHLVGKDKS